MADFSFMRGESMQIKSPWFAPCVFVNSMVQYVLSSQNNVDILEMMLCGYG